MEGERKMNCHKYSDSISPLTMPKSNREIKELLGCLERDAKTYLSSLEIGSDDYINHFKKSIMPIVKKRELLESFKNQLMRYERVLEAKTISVHHDLRISFNKLENDIKNVNVLNKYESLDKGTKESQFFTHSLKIVYVDHRFVSNCFTTFLCFRILL